MTPTSLPLLTLAALGAATSSLGPNALSLGEIQIAALDAATALDATQVGGSPAVRIEGGDLGVAISPPKGDARTLVFGVRHRDAGTHAFDVAFGTGEGWVQAGFQCDATPPASAVEIRCNSFVPGTGEGHDPKAVVPGTGEGHGSLVVTPRFAAAKRYSLRATRHGQLVIDTAGLEGAYTIEDFEGLEEATKYETLEVQVAYGAVRPDAWSVTIRHEGWVVSVTPDAKQAFDGLPTVQLRTKGLEEAVLTGVCTRQGVGKPALDGCK